MKSKAKTKKKRCICGDTFTPSGRNTQRCPDCQIKYRMAYNHAYRRGIFLTRDDWMAYYTSVILFGCEVSK